MKKRPFTFDEADYRLRVLLAEEGYEQPDEVHGGPDEITMVWDGYPPVTAKLSDFEEPIDRIERLMNGGETKTVAEITAKMSKLLYDGGVPKPDGIRAGPESHEVSFIWTAEKVIIVVDRRSGPRPEDLAPFTATAG